MAQVEGPVLGGARTTRGGRAAVMRAVLAVLFGLGHVAVVVTVLVAGLPDVGTTLLGATAGVGVAICVAVAALNVTGSRSLERRVRLRPVARRVAVIALVAQVLTVLVTLASYFRPTDVFADALAAMVQLLFSTALAVATWHA